MMSKTRWIILSIVLISGASLLAEPPATTIGPPYIPGVPDWVYTSRVPRDVRSLFILQYGMLYQAELYQKSIYPTSAAENFKVLADELANVFSAFAGKDVNGKDIPTDLPDSDQGLFQIDVPVMIQRLYSRIRQEVFKNNLQDIANSPDLVPSLVRGRRTTIGPPPARPKVLTHDEVMKMLGHLDLQDVQGDPTSKSLLDQYHALKSEVEKAYREEQKQGDITVAGELKCLQLPSSREALACQQTYQEPFNLANQALDRANQAMYKFQDLYYCTEDRCVPTKH